jgi:RNA polymerase sigma-70 factor (ECF subfamily)
VTDSEIIDLYLRRSEDAISETQKQYGSYCRSIAMNILHNSEDADECVNDTFLKLWNSIPPERPQVFSTFVGRIVRNLSLDRAKLLNAKKRGGGETPLLLSELEGCIPAAAVQNKSKSSVEDAVDNNELEAAINDFLSEQKQDTATYFICRYWHGDSVAEIARRAGVSEGKIAMNLHRTRKKLKVCLEKRGISI